MNNALLFPLLAYILWATIIYLLLTVVRAPVIWGFNANSKMAKSFEELEPRISANLSNQFEWPVLFFTISTILIARPDLYETSHFWLACLFVLGRVIHSVVHIFTTNTQLRGTVFNINFLAVLAMWGVLAFNL